MGRKRKNKPENEEEVSEFEADTPEFQQRLWTALTDFKRLENRCTTSVEAYVKMCRADPTWKVEDTKLGPLCYRDLGSDVLAVAHIDAVGDDTHFGAFRLLGKDWYVFSPWLDDRLGAFIILDVLPALGFKYDLLLCTNEEHGQSTGQFFVPPPDKKYRYLVEFDRMGDDVVNYQYNQPEMEKALRAAGFPFPGRGTYTDIVTLEGLHVGAFNVAIGYEQPHSEWCRANLTVTFRQLVKYCRFAEATEGIAFPFDHAKGNPHHRRPTAFQPPASATPTNGQTSMPLGYPPNTEKALVKLPASSNGGTGSTPGTASGLTSRPKPNFPLATDDWVLVDGEEHLWRVDSLGPWDEPSNCWRWHLRRTTPSGSVISTSIPERRLILKLPHINGQTPHLMLRDWILFGRPAGWRHSETVRWNRILTTTVNGQAAPPSVMTSYRTRLLWEAHLGQQYQDHVKLARKEYEADVFDWGLRNEPVTKAYSTEWVGHVGTYTHHLGDLVKVHFNAENAARAVVCSLWPVVLTDNSCWWWVDYELPDSMGMHMAVEPETKLELLIPGKDRFGLYTPELRLGMVVPPVQLPSEGTGNV